MTSSQTYGTFLYKAKCSDQTTNKNVFIRTKQSQLVIINKGLPFVHPTHKVLCKVFEELFFTEIFKMT